MSKKDKPIPRFSVHKAFWDYLFDFFMLFLAVTLGFFSNNLREGIIDNNNEKEYIVRLIRDMESDTTDLGRLLKDNLSQLQGMDTLLRLFEDNDLNPPVNELYRLSLAYLGSYTGFSPRDITINQMKSAGDLNLVGDKATSDSIIYYYAAISECDEQLEYNSQFFQQTVAMEFRMLDYSVYRKSNRAKTLRNRDELPDLYNRILMMGSLVQGDRVWMKKVKANGDRLIAFLKEKYDIQP